MMLLTLDPGGNVGWSLGPLDPNAPNDQVEFGTIKLKETTDIHTWLRSGDEYLQILFGRADRYVVEKPNTRNQHYVAIRKLMFCLGHMHYLAGFAGLPAGVEENVGQIKKAWTGNGNANKDMMIAEAIRRGFDVQTEHEADALAIRHVHLHGPVDPAQKKTAKKKPVAKGQLNLLESPASPSWNETVKSLVDFPDLDF